MTASAIPPQRASLTSPIIDYEPAPVPGQPAPGLNVAGQPAPGLNVAGQPAPCPPPTPAALHRHTPRRSPRRPVAPRPIVREPRPPHAAVVFADAALRRVLEVADRRRPVAQLRPLVAPALIDVVVALTRTPHTATATLRRVRLRMVDDEAAEVFGSFTRGQRVRAIAARVERDRDQWRIVALQVG